MKIKLTKTLGTDYNLIIKHNNINYDFGYMFNIHDKPLYVTSVLNECIEKVQYIEQNIHLYTLDIDTHNNNTINVNDCV